MREEISGELIRKLNVVARVEEQCAVGCIGQTSDDTEIEYVG